MSFEVQTAIASLVTLFSVVISIFVAFVIVRSPKLMEDLTSMAMLSLCASDLGNGLFVSGFSAVLMWTGLADFPSSVLVVQYAALILFAAVSAWNLALVSIFKCAVIVRPLNYWTVLTARTQAAFVGGVWTLGVALAVLPFMTGGRAEFSREMAAVIFLDTFTPFFGLFVGFIIPSAVILVANFKIFLVVRRHKRSIVDVACLPQGPQGPFPDGHVNYFARSVKSAKNIFVICIAYWVVYAPSVSSLAVSSSWYMFVTNWIYLCNPIINSLLYIGLHKNVQAEIRKVFCGGGRGAVGEGFTTSYNRTKVGAGNSVGLPVPS